MWVNRNETETESELQRFIYIARRARWESKLEAHAVGPGRQLWVVGAPRLRRHGRRKVPVSKHSKLYQRRSESL